MRFLKMRGGAAPGAGDIVLVVPEDEPVRSGADDIVLVVPEDDPFHVTESPLVLGDPRFIYVPLWDAAEDGVFAYRCTPLWQSRDGELRAIDSLSAAFAGPVDRLSIDLELFDRAIAHLNRIVAQYGILKIVIPVHLSTLLDDELREAYLAACGESVWSVFDNVCFEIVDVGADVSGVRLAAAVEFIRPYGNRIFVCLDSNDVECLPRGMDAASLFIGRNARRIESARGDVGDQLRRFGESAAASPYRTYVHGLRSLDDTAAAIDAGFTIVGSEAIAPALDEPAQPVAAEETTRMLRTLMMGRLHA